MEAAINVVRTTDETQDSLNEQHAVLINKVRSQHDRGAFRALFEHFGPRIKGLMIKAGADYQLAEDLVQDVMITVWRKADLYAPERGSVGAWIYTIARNARIDRLRGGSSQPYEDVDSLELPSGDADVEEQIFAVQRAEQVAVALAALPAEQRQVIELSFRNDMAQSEIAGKLDLPLGTVKSRMRLAYSKLKAELEELR
jgi:RNA polymerase sigma-70 factor (ECF subfamily)